MARKHGRAWTAVANAWSLGVACAPAATPATSAGLPTAVPKSGWAGRPMVVAADITAGA